MHQNAVADVLHQTAEVVAAGGRLGGAARCRRGLRRRLVLHYQPVAAPAVAVVKRARLDGAAIAAGAWAKLGLAEFSKAVAGQRCGIAAGGLRSEEHTSELPSLMRISYAAFCLNNKKIIHNTATIT